MRESGDRPFWVKSCCAIAAHLGDGGGHHDEEVVEEAEDGDAREHDQPEPDEDEDLLVHDVDRLQIRFIIQVE